MNKKIYKKKHIKIRPLVKPQLNFCVKKIPIIKSKKENDVLNFHHKKCIFTDIKLKNIENGELKFKNHIFINNLKLRDVIHEIMYHLKFI